ncbi:MAG: hypothetical protein JWR37_627 [Mycobacterium sp.]|nr:hypothetical protein [Mycobacterium sp.]
MWEVVTSQGIRVSNIAHEDDARRTIHSFGLTHHVGMYDYQVFPYTGTPFMATLRRQPSRPPVRPGRSLYR